jgi:hypothetical protein
VPLITFDLNLKVVASAEVGPANWVTIAYAALAPMLEADGATSGVDRKTAASSPEGLAGLKPITCVLLINTLLSCLTSNAP